MKYVFFIIFTTMVNVLSCEAQNNDSKDLHVLYILKYKSKEVKTNNFICLPEDIRAIDIHNKSENLPELSTMQEDEAVIIDLIKDVKLLNLSMLFDKFHIDDRYRKFAIRIDDKTILNNPRGIIATNDAVDTIIIDSLAKFLNIKSEIRKPTVE